MMIDSLKKDEKTKEKAMLPTEIKEKEDKKSIN